MDPVRGRLSRRKAAQCLGAAAFAVTRSATAAQSPSPAILMDGHVHVTNRIYWEKIDPWASLNGGWTFAQARESGVNCIIENVGTHGYWNYNYAPKQTLRLIETLHAFTERNAGKMAIALSPADARRIVASGRMAVFLGCEAGWDQEGDPDVLAAFYRLGLRTVQFATQSGFNAFADTAAAPLGGQAADHYRGLNDRGRSLIAKMNDLGILIDITHATEAAQLQIVEASRAPVVISHESLRSVSGAGISDDVLTRVANKGGMIGIHGAAGVIGRRYRKWLADNPDKAKDSAAPALAMIAHKASGERPPGDRGEFIAQFDREAEQLWRGLTAWKEFPEAVAFIPTADEWAEHVAHAVKMVGADHVGIGLDMTGGRSGVPANAGGYQDLVRALERITSAENVRKIAGENWLRVLAQAKA